MRTGVWLALLAPTILLAPGPAMAQGTSQWRVTGDISGKSFVLKCQFEEKGQHLGGICVELASSASSAEKVGKSHPLTDGSIRGNDITWSYGVKVMLMPVEIKFAGQISGPRMIGTISAKGRQGTFSATRL